MILSATSTATHVLRGRPGAVVHLVLSRPSQRPALPFAIDELAAASRTRRLDPPRVFGGDAIITADSTVPSSTSTLAELRKCEEAARQIAWHLSNRLKALRLPPNRKAWRGEPGRRPATASKTSSRELPS